jgi:hypothetical protein
MSPANHHSDLPAAATGTDEPLAPVEDQRVGTVPLGELGARPGSTR